MRDFYCLELGAGSKLLEGVGDVRNRSFFVSELKG